MKHTGASRHKGPREADTLKAIMDYLDYHGYLYLRHNSIKPIAHKIDGNWSYRWARLRESQKGAPDIVVFLPPINPTGFGSQTRYNATDGRAVAIEVKGTGGSASVEQKLWEQRAHKIGVKYVLARNLDDVLAALK